MARYFERGGNFIDTANGYTGGHSERIIGNYIAHDRARRDEIVIATKFFSNLSRRNPNGGGASRKAVVASCEQSLRRLRTDYIDLYWMHVWDRFTPIDETMRALDDLVRAGKVRYIGFSDTPAWKVSQAQTMALFRGWTPLVALQIEYSLLERTVEGELVPMAQELGLGITPWSPLAGGVLSGKFQPRGRGLGRARTAAPGRCRASPNAHVHDPRRSDARGRRAEHDAGGGGAGLGAVASGRRLDHHRRAPPRSARRQPGGPGPAAAARARARRSTRCRRRCSISRRRSWAGRSASCTTG